MADSKHPDDAADGPGAASAGRSNDHPITLLLQAMAQGQRGAQQELLPLIYDHLRSIARAQLSGERRDCSIGATSLVHEAYLRILGGDAVIDWTDRRHFFNAAARAMRFVLVDRARALRAGRDAAAGAAVHGGPRRPVALPRDVVDQATGSTSEAIEALDDALQEFERLDPRAAQVVLWRFYNGMTIEAVAAHLGCGIQTVNRDWRRARAWLADRLMGEAVSDPEGKPAVEGHPGGPG